MEKLRKDKKEEGDDRHLKKLKEWIKKNPIKTKGELKPGCVRVKPGRTKKDPITVEGSLADHRFRWPHDPNSVIKLTVTATPQDWEKLEDFIRDDPKGFGRDLNSIFVYRAVLDINTKVRGKHKRTHHFVTATKIKAGVLYSILSYWCKRPLKEWPDYLQKLIDMAKKEDTEIYIKENDSYKPTELTAYCIDKVYGQIAHALGLKPFFEFEQRESIENFLYHLYPGQQKTSQTY